MIFIIDFFQLESPFENNAMCYLNLLIIKNFNEMLQDHYKYYY